MNRILNGLMWILALAPVWMPFTLPAQPSEGENEEIRKLRLSIKEGKTEDIHKLREYELEEVLPVFRLLIARKSDEAATVALEVLRSYPQPEEVVGADIENRMSKGDIGRALGEDFDLLIAMRTPKAARIVGNYLYDERVFPSGMHDVADESAVSYAVPALAQFQFRGAPHSWEGWRAIGSKGIQQWKVWWEANKDNLEAALNPPSEAQAQTPPPQAPGIEPNLPPRPEAGDEAPSTPAASDLNVPALLLVVLGSLLAAVAAILLRRDRK